MNNDSAGKMNVNNEVAGAPRLSCWWDELLTLSGGDAGKRVSRCADKK